MTKRIESRARADSNSIESTALEGLGDVGEGKESRS